MEQKEVTWDEKKYFKVFDEVKHDYESLKKFRADIFQNTIDITDQGYYTVDGKKIEIDLPSEAKIYKQIHKIDAETLPSPTDITVEKEDCMAVGIRLSKEGFNPLILNMANAFNVGGGVIKGSMAQEEEIFRCTNIFESLFPLHPKTGAEYGYEIDKEKIGYPIQKYGALYSPNVTIFRKGKLNGYKLLEEPIKIAFVSAAAFKDPQMIDEDTLEPYYVLPMMEKIRTILRVGLDNGHDAFVLGAWGCGAFKNPPKHIAKLFHKVLEEEEFKNKYKIIVFAILEDYNSLKNGRKGNLKPFQEEFKGE